MSNRLVGLVHGLTLVLASACVFVQPTLAAAQAGMMTAPKEIARITNEESAWSPDGKRIAFDSDRAGKFTSLYVLDVATNDTTRLTAVEANDITPAWSPDGRRIAFVSDRTGHNQIYVMDSAGGTARRITTDTSDDLHPSWSPDGTRIAYCSARDNPDQSAAAEGTVYEIYCVDPDGKNDRQVTRLGGINTYPNYSPDGKRILFRRVLGKRDSEVWIMDVDGKNPVNLTNNPAFDAWPFWAPDGRRIVFGSDRSGEFQIYTMNSDGTSVRPLTNVKGYTTSPKWSPDGRHVSFDLAVDRKVSIVVVDIE